MRRSNQLLLMSCGRRWCGKNVIPTIPLQYRPVLPRHARIHTTLPQCEPITYTPPPLPSPTPIGVLHAHHTDTIYTVSTGVSPSQPTGVAVIRITGPHAHTIHTHITCRTKPQPPRLLTLNTLYSTADGTVIEPNVLTVLFTAPHSYTGEDTVELHTHGNALLVNLILASVQHAARCITDQHGRRIRVAQAGEMTRRAFQNGKLDLLGVESLNDLMHVQTEEQHRQAVRCIQSQSYAHTYTAWRLLLVECLAHVEAIIDFAEDEDDVGEHEILTQVQPKLDQLHTYITAALQSSKRSELVRSGIQCVIAGPPNAGKSSLINLLCKRNVSIVSSMPGTTRDVVETKLNIGGHAVVLADTAGLRHVYGNDGHEAVEAMGIARARERLQDADIKIVMFDVTTLLSNSEQLSGVDNEAGKLVDANTVVLLNKADTTQQLDRIDSAGILKQLSNFLQSDLTANLTHSATDDACIAAALHTLGCRTMPAGVCVISCNTQAGIDDMLQQLTDLIERKLNNTAGTHIKDNDIPLVTQHRHREHLERCIELLYQYTVCMQRDDIVLAAEQLRLSVRELGAIIGTVHVEQLLDVIFKDFCIGK